MTPAQKRLEEARAALAAAEAAALEEEAVRTEKAARINARIDRQLDALQAQVNALHNRMLQLERRRPRTEQPAAEATPQPARASRTRGGQGGRNYRTPRYMFHKEYQRVYKTKAHTHRLITATCKEHNIDPADRSPQNLARVHAILTGEAQA